MKTFGKIKISNKKTAGNTVFLLAGLKFTSERFLVVVQFIIFTKLAITSPANRNTQPLCIMLNRNSKQK